MLVFHSVEEMESYYSWEKNVYIMKDENGNLEDVCLKFNFHCPGKLICRHLIAKDLSCWELKAENVDCQNLTAQKIHAGHIYYHALCVAYKEFICKSAAGKRKNARHFCLDKEVIYTE